MGNPVKTIPISKVEISDDEIRMVADVLRSGHLIAGEKCAEFEKKFAEYTGAKYAVTLNSGTSALYLAYRMLLKPGDEVLVPSFTFFATASMVVAAGARPVFCDVDPETFTIDLEDMERKYSPKVKALAPVHIFGNPCKMDDIIDFAQEKKLFIIWDAAQAHGTHYKGRDVGSFNDIACYSFYPSKNMTTGEGGMLTTNNEEYDKTLRLLRSQGQPKKYYHTMIAYNFRLTDFQSAIGIGQLAKLQGWVDQRRGNAHILREGLKGLEKIFIQKEQTTGKHSYHQFGVQLKDLRGSVIRDKFVVRLKEKGIMAGTHFPIPLHQQPIFREMFGNITLPKSEAIAQNIITLPAHPYLTREDLDTIVGAFHDTYKELL